MILATRVEIFWVHVFTRRAMKKDTLFAFSMRHVLIQRDYRVQVNLVVFWLVVKLAIMEQTDLI